MRQNKHLIFVFMASGAVLAMGLLPVIPQDPAYHAFADQQNLFGIVNFLNVISNLPFLVVGILGIDKLYRLRGLVIVDTMKPVYGVFFISVGFIALGSIVYHLQPNNFTLLWDRLPMSLAFMAFFTIVVGEYIDDRIATKIFIPLLLIGPVSVIYWYWTESTGAGDLRLYILVQYLPLLLIPFILWRRSCRFSHGAYYWAIIACYLLAKVLELADARVFEILTLVSGHSLKHLVSALAAYVFYAVLKNRHAV